MSREHRETSRVRWPRNATERAILCVVANWWVIEVQRNAGWRR